MNLRLFFSCGMLFLIMFVTSVIPVSAQMLGGYSDVSVTDPGVIAAANFAIHEQSEKEHVAGGHAGLKLDEILSARQQVVAGMNYDLQLKVQIKNQNKIAEAIVNRNLHETYQLTSWVWK